MSEKFLSKFSVLENLTRPRILFPSVITKTVNNKLKKIWRQVVYLDRKFVSIKLEVGKLIDVGVSE